MLDLVAQRVQSWRAQADLVARKRERARSMVSGEDRIVRLCPWCWVISDVEERRDECKRHPPWAPGDAPRHGAREGRRS